MSESVQDQAQSTYFSVQKRGSFAVIRKILKYSVPLSKHAYFETTPDSLLLGVQRRLGISKAKASADATHNQTSDETLMC